MFFNKKLELLIVSITKSFERIILIFSAKKEGSVTTHSPNARHNFVAMPLFDDLESWRHK